MSVHDSIANIQARMRQIRSRFETMPSTIQQAVNSLPLEHTPAAMGVSFEQILATAQGGLAYPGGPVSYTDREARFAPYIKEASEKYNVPEALIKAVITQESGFDPNATSSCGAQGLMQLMPETAAGLSVKNPYDPRENIMGGVKYLRQLLDRFGGDIPKALAAYNAGPGAVEKYGGIPPYKETENYVQNITAMYERFSRGGA